MSKRRASMREGPLADLFRQTDGSQENVAETAAESAAAAAAAAVPAARAGAGARARGAHPRARRGRARPAAALRPPNRAPARRERALRASAPARRARSVRCARDARAAAGAARARRGVGLPRVDPRRRRRRRRPERAPAHDRRRPPRRRVRRDQHRRAAARDVGCRRQAADRPRSHERARLGMPTRISAARPPRTRSTACARCCAAPISCS